MLDMEYGLLSPTMIVLLSLELIINSEVLDSTGARVSPMTLPLLPKPPPQSKGLCKEINLPFHKA